MCVYSWMIVVIHKLDHLFTLCYTTGLKYYLRMVAYKCTMDFLNDPPGLRIIGFAGSLTHPVIKRGNAAEAEWIHTSSCESDGSHGSHGSDESDESDY